MRVVSVNVGRREVLTGPGFEAETGIGKRPAEGPVAVGPLGLDGDVIADTESHGGPDQAVYVYRQEDYDWWASELGRPMEPGLFGENLTLAGLPTTDPPIGTRFQFAELELEVTCPRIPCSTLSTRMGEPKFLKAFVRAERPGMYCRVLTPGNVAAQDAFDVLPPAESIVSLLDLFRAYYQKPGAGQIRSILEAPIAHRMRERLEWQLRELDSDAS